MCLKRPFASAGFRIRVYFCWECGAYHVTNSEKRRGRYREDYEADEPFERRKPL